jgi:hypothetical protein
MELKINEYILKMQGKATLMQELELGNSFSLQVKGAVDQTTDQDNEDGTIQRIYRFKPLMVDVIYDNGQITKTKDTRSRSQQMRACIRREWQEFTSDLDENDYYDSRMMMLIGKIIRKEV